MIDETSFPKQGTHSAGVTRQYCRALGKIGNCQVGVFLANVGSRDHTPPDRELYLPAAWTDDPVRMQAVGLAPDTPSRPCHSWRSARWHGSLRPGCLQPGGSQGPTEPKKPAPRGRAGGTKHFAQLNVSCVLMCRKAVSTAAVSVRVAVKVRWGMASCLRVRKVRSMSFSSGL